MTALEESGEKKHQLTPRDKMCLLWIGLQYAIRLDQLQRLLFQYTPEQDRYKLKPDTNHLSLDRTYEIINKWLVLGLVEKDTILHGDKMWIWLSRHGLREVRLSFNYGDGAPSSVRLPHLYYINQVRLFLEEQHPYFLWKSERELFRGIGLREKGKKQPHTPDAIITNTANGKVTALEIERSAKNETEFEDDLHELAVSYKSVWYFVTGATRRQIESMLETFLPEVRKPFVLYNLGEYGDAYEIS